MFRPPQGRSLGPAWQDAHNRLAICQEAGPWRGGHEIFEILMHWPGACGGGAVRTAAGIPKTGRQEAPRSGNQVGSGLRESARTRRPGGRAGGISPAGSTLVRRCRPTDHTAPDARPSQGQAPAPEPRRVRAGGARRVRDRAGRRDFANREKAQTWLRRPTSPLGGRRPLDLLDSEPGAGVVEQLLYRIGQGV